MNNTQEILNELKDLSPLLAGLEKINVFQVPDGYFDNLSERISNFAIFNTFNEFSVNKTNVQQVPQGYFDSLSTNILSKIKKLYPETAEEELRTLSPMLLLLKNKNVFEIPDGYFKDFTNNLFKKLNPTTAKIVVMKPRNTWMKIAAAAVVTGIIAISSLQIFNNVSNQDNTKAVIIASSDLPDYMKQSYQFKTEEQLDAGIAKLSEDDIIKYLEKNGNVMDNDLLLKNTDVNELPEEADYLTNENTLNSYLDKIDGKSNAN